MEFELYPNNKNRYQEDRNLKPFSRREYADPDPYYTGHLFTEQIEPENQGYIDPL